MKVQVFRLERGTEVLGALQDLVKESLPQGGCVLSCAGSVTEGTLRFATRKGDDEKIETLTGNFEVLSLSGTLSSDGLHLHISLGDAAGRTVGGHVVGNLVTQTTMELVLGCFDEVELTRKYDFTTGFKELVVTPFRKKKRRMFCCEMD